jgi:hypothetical protein
LCRPDAQLPCSSHPQSLQTLALQSCELQHFELHFSTFISILSFTLLLISRRGLTTRLLHYADSFRDSTYSSSFTPTRSLLPHRPYILQVICLLFSFSPFPQRINTRACCLLRSLRLHKRVEHSPIPLTTDERSWQLNPPQRYGNAIVAKGHLNCVSTQQSAPK